MFLFLSFSRFLYPVIFCILLASPSPLSRLPSPAAFRKLANNSGQSPPLKLQHCVLLFFLPSFPSLFHR